MSSNLKTSQDKLKVLVELGKRHGLEAALRASLFDRQLEAIEDPAKLKTWQCTRRAGKSYAWGTNAALVCNKFPSSTCLYIATTRAQAKKIMFKDVLKVINRNFQIGMKFNETDLTATFPNGSVIYLIGCDSKPEEADKALGQKYRLCGIDEGASWKNDQRYLVHSVLEPACADYEGTIIMLGSPGNSLKTYFYDITGRAFGDDKYVSGWSRHVWSWQDNPHVRDNMRKLIERLKNQTPGIEETPVFKQMYLNQWVVDTSALVYKFDETKNLATHLPKDHHYHYALSLDLGFEDDTAFVVETFSDTDPNMYFIEAFKKKGMDITAVAEKLNYFKLKYPHIQRWIVDGASKQAVEELRNRHGFPLEASDKQGKSDIIEIMNADFFAGRIKVLPEAMDLVDEWGNLIWDDRSSKRVEHPACPNHLADAGLYGWRMCYHYYAKPAVQRPKPGTNEAIEEWWEQQAIRGKKAKSRDFASRDFGEDYGIGTKLH